MIYETLKDTAKISKTGGGIGISIHNIRSEGSPIKSNGSKSSGIVPMAKVFESTARLVSTIQHGDCLGSVGGAVGVSLRIVPGFLWRPSGRDPVQPPAYRPRTAATGTRRRRR